jgi:hypothetical protein
MAAGGSFFSGLRHNDVDFKPYGHDAGPLFVIPAVRHPGSTSFRQYVIPAMFLSRDPAEIQSFQGVPASGSRIQDFLDKLCRGDGAGRRASPEVNNIVAPPGQNARGNFNGSSKTHFSDRRSRFHRFSHILEVA